MFQENDSNHEITCDGSGVSGAVGIRVDDDDDNNDEQDSPDVTSPLLKSPIKSKSYSRNSRQQKSRLSNLYSNNKGNAWRSILSSHDKNEFDKQDDLNSN